MPLQTNERRSTAQGQRVRVRPRVGLHEELRLGVEPAEARDRFLEAFIELGILLVRHFDARREVVQTRHLFQRRREARPHRSLEEPQRASLDGRGRVLVERVAEGLGLELRELDSR